MHHRFSKGHVVLLCVSLCFVYSGFSQTAVLKRKAAFNQGWKFIKSDPGTAASGTSYNDASWATVNIPHSASYDSAVASAEQNYFVGTCWYRKSFTLPANVKKVFIEFEGAMQVANVYLNGNQVGTHNNSGYTPFSFDISNQVTRGGGNVLALSLNNARSADIPPGWASAGPDYYLFGGLTRSVWLHFKDSVYIPVYAQQILPMPNASATSAQLRVKTPVMNASKSAQTATVKVRLYDAANTLVTTDSATQSIAAGALVTVDHTSATFSCSPWAPQTPAMYTVRTSVIVGGATVDSVVEPCGFRNIAWSTSNGLSINGVRTEIHGMCVHSAMGWIENAVPDERYYYEVKMVKEMGGNSIRCSHYPRAQAFYNACDKLGMLLYVEQPSWGYSMNPNAACWAKMDSCVREMVIAGRNHPSIYAWGLYNEPNNSNNPEDYTSYITTMNNTAHSLDSTRITSIADNGNTTCMVVPDAVCMNYSTSTSYTNNGKNTANMYWLNCEARNSGTFGTRNSRGSQVDLDTSDVQDCGGSAGNAACEWASFSFSTATSGHLAGGHFWEFKDHNSSWNSGAFEGVVDFLDVPKTMYYYFAKKWVPGLVADYARPGTATKIDFKADTNSLPADSVNVFLLTAAMRDANNHLISSNPCQVKFVLSDPTKGIVFGGNLAYAYGGMAEAFLRTSKSPGTFTVTATSVCNTSLSAQTITLTTTAVPTETYVADLTDIKLSSVRAKTGSLTLTVSHISQCVIFLCPRCAGHLKVIDCRGRTVYSQEVSSGASVPVSRRALGAGLFYGVWEDANAKEHLVSRVTAVD